MKLSTAASERARRATRFALHAAVLSFGAFFNPAPTVADTIHTMAGGSYYHHQSGWVFPAKIGEFALVGAPQDVNGTDDVVAYYARVSKGVRTVASVNVYGLGSAEAQTTTRANVYFVATAAWLVKIRASVPATDQEMGPVLEAFARGQRWDSLQLAN